MHHRLVGEELLGRADVHDLARVEDDGVSRDPLDDSEILFDEQHGRQLRDALEASWAKQFVFCKTSTDGEVPQPQQLDVWMVGVVTLVAEDSESVSLLGSNSVVPLRTNKRMLMGDLNGGVHWLVSE